MSEQTTAIVPAKANVVLSTGGAMVRSFDDLARLSTMIARSGLAPRDMNTPEKIGVAIMWGMEVGLSAVQSVQSIAVINNRPCLWGDALPALVQSSPVCEYTDECIEGEGDGMVAVCTSKRRNSSKIHTTRFSVADAKKANLWGKQGPWTQYPKRMLQVRARAFNFRDNFADVLRGIGVAEEQQDMIDTPATVVVTSGTPQSPVSPALPAKSVLDEYTDDGTSEEDRGQSDTPPVTPAEARGGSDAEGSPAGGFTPKPVTEAEVAHYPSWYVVMEDEAQISEWSMEDFTAAIQAVKLAHPVAVENGKGEAARRTILEAMRARKLSTDGKITN